jgi:glycosyltransferase involved in cell wall biosynthesis
MIVKNEEQYLEACLQSAKEVVSETVIVDTGSTDGTMQIAKEFNARVAFVEWNGDFAAARNAALRLCRGDWVLSLDADERLMSCQAEKFEALMEDPKVGAYTLLIEGDHHFPEGVVRQVNAYPRLFRCRPSIRFQGKVHEQIAPSVLAAGFQVQSTSIVIEHLGYKESWQKIQEKCHRNLNILRSQLQGDARNAYLHYQIGNTLTVLRDYDRARPELFEVLKANQCHPSLRASAHNLLGEADVKRQELQKAVGHYRESIRIVPRQIMGHWFLSGVLMTLGDSQEAMEVLEQVWNQVHSGVPSELAHDIRVTPEELHRRMLLCFEGRASNLLTRGSFGLVEDLVARSSSMGVASFQLSWAALQAALARSDIQAAYHHLQILLSLLPSDNASVREKLEEISRRLASGSREPASINTSA